jgi:hypothetical protein
MNIPIKAALCSALIFPGAGQLILKKYLSACYFAIFAGVGLYLLFANLMVRAESIIDKIQRGEVIADIATITQLVHKQSAAVNDSLSPALIIFSIAWLVSVVEAYRLGKKQTKK